MPKMLGTKTNAPIVNQLPRYFLQCEIMTPTRRSHGLFALFQNLKLSKGACFRVSKAVCFIKCHTWKKATRCSGEYIFTWVAYITWVGLWAQTFVFTCVPYLTCMFLASWAVSPIICSWPLHIYLGRLISVLTVSQHCSQIKTSILSMASSIQ